MRIAPPPSSLRPDPIIHTLGPGATLVRIFDPTGHGATATGFRPYGPLARFDHHRGRGRWRSPGPDPERGVYYAAFTLSGCLVEVFGDAGTIWFGEQRVASPRLGRELRLLDLRDHGAMRAGSVAALAKTADRRISQAWSRFFYERVDLYGTVDGLVFYNAHNDEPAVVLYERAADALECPDERVVRFDDPVLRAAIVEAAVRNHLELV